jgi:hypothetical protein
MAGTIHRVIPKQLFDFSGGANSSAQPQVVARAIPVAQWQEAVLLVRLHSNDGAAWTTGQSIKVDLLAEGYTDEDPDEDFVIATPLATVTFSGASAGTSPTLSIARAEFGGGPGQFGAYLRVVVTGTQSTSAQALRGWLSVDLSLKA